jgi:hypothetical protein
VIKLACQQPKLVINAVSGLRREGLCNPQIMPTPKLGNLPRQTCQKQSAWHNHKNKQAFHGR